jgi:hypothetical protein
VSNAVGVPFIRLLDLLGEWFATIVSIATLPMLVLAPVIAILRGSRRSSGGLESGPLRKILSIAIALLVVILFVWLFSYVYDSAAPSWEE